MTVKAFKQNSKITSAMVRLLRDALVTMVTTNSIIKGCVPIYNNSYIPLHAFCARFDYSGYKTEYFELLNVFCSSRDTDMNIVDQNTYYWRR